MYWRLYFQFEYRFRGSTVLAYMFNEFSKLYLVLASMMQWRLSAARCIQAFISLLIHRLAIWNMSDMRTSLIVMETMFLFQISITAHKPFPNLYVFSFIRYLSLGCVLHLQTLYITNDPSKEEPRYFLIYYYITGFNGFRQ